MNYILLNLVFTDAKMLETTHPKFIQIESSAHFFDWGNRIVIFYAGALMQMDESYHP